MKGALINLFMMACFVVAIAHAEGPFEEGLKPTQLAQIAHTLPGTYIQSIQLFREKNNGRLSAAVLTSSRRTGWQVFLISPRGLNGYRRSWVSAKLPDSFAVSSPHALTTYGLTNEEAVVFSGCAPHMCPDIFSALLYVPTQHRAFVATCSDGQTAYSFALTTASQEYKTVLNEILHKIDGHGTAHACSPEKREER